MADDIKEEVQSKRQIMTKLPCFASAELEAVCKVLADTANGLTGSEIAQLLLEIGVADTAPSMTKWKRLYNALADKQNQVEVGNFLIQFVNKAMAPAKYVSAPELFRWRRDGLNVALAFAGYRVREDGLVGYATRESTVDGARARAGRLVSVLISRTAAIYKAAVPLLKKLALCPIRRKRTQVR